MSEDEKGTQESTFADLEQYKKDSRKSFLERLDERGVKMLWSFVERDASTWRFWIKITVVMVLVYTALPMAGYLFLLGRDLGYFD